MTPNVENIRAWVDALRSGRFEQGTGKLLTRNDDHVEHYCCLGVASRIAVDSGDVHLQIKFGDHSPVAVFVEPGLSYQEENLLPSSVRKWLGLISSNPHVSVDRELADLRHDGDTKPTLANVNDRGSSFAEIADLIEAEWLTPAPSEVSS